MITTQIQRPTLTPEAEETQQCRVCLLVLPVERFSPRAKMKRGISKICKPCASEQAMAWRDANALRYRDARLQKKYGITLDQFNSMLADQAGVCAICGQTPAIVNWRLSRRQGRLTEPMLVVDHNHATGEIRGLLCVPCNRGIGFLKDDATLVSAALKYLEAAADV